MDMEVSTSLPSNETPAGYLSLVDNRSQHQSQRMHRVTFSFVPS